jgi:hypothetical protein
MFDKIKAIAKAFAFTVILAAIAAGLEFTNAVDWTGFGIFGPAIGLAVGTGGAFLLGYAKKEFTGYGTTKTPQIPDGKEG